jgi:rRNA-processing protein FCF1
LWPAKNRGSNERYPNCGSLPAKNELFANMNVVDYRSLAQEWLEHVVQQYEMTHVCAKDLRLIEYLLKEGFTLMAVRDQSKVLRVDFLAKCRKRLHRKKPARTIPVGE